MPSGVVSSRSRYSIQCAILEAGLRQPDPDALDGIPEIIDQAPLFDLDKPEDARALARVREAETGS